MVRDIIKDPNILTQPSEPFIPGQDNDLLWDMLDTANAHKANCAGLAAIQIGIPKRVILVRHGNKFVPYVNPKIIKYGPGAYYATEGCLSVDGTKRVKRHRSIMLSYDGANGKRIVKQFNDYIAQIIQHEVDHCNGKLI